MRGRNSQSLWWLSNLSYCTHCSICISWRSGDICLSRSVCQDYVSRFINYATHVGVANEFISKDSSHFSCYYKCW